jgi:glycosyltransferase involved in cell wall biosynthesis
MKVSVVVAAYNEAPVIEKVVRAALAAVPGCEVIVADDGSTDGTGAVASKSGAIVVQLHQNRGKGHAVRAGLVRASGDVIVLIDGDGQDDPAEIPLLLAALEEADLVVGSRFLGRLGPGAITAVNHAGNRFLTAVLNRLFSVQLTDTQAGFKALRRSLAMELPLGAGRFDIEVDVLLGVLQRGGRVVEVPVGREARPYGASRFNRILDGTRILLRIVKKRLSGPARAAARPARSEPRAP